MVRQAAYWAAQLATDEATQEDRDACADWCDAHPLHRLAMERMRGLDARIAATDATGREAMEAVLESRSRRGRRLGAAMLGAALVLGTGWLAGHSLVLRAWFPDYRTARGDQQVVALADGSALTLDSDAALDFDQRGERRTVTLFQGQVLARVAKDAARPFVVETRDGTATALGTVFSVRRDAEGTTVTVLQSHVRACPAGAVGADCAVLGPGEQVRLAGGRLNPVVHVDPKAAGLWAEGWLAVDDQPVSAVLDELNRYLRQPVSYDKAELGTVHVSGSFPLREPDRALDAILTSTGLELSRSPDGSRVVHRSR